MDTQEPKRIVPVKCLGQVVGRATVNKAGTVIAADIEPEYAALFDTLSPYYAFSLGYRFPAETPKEK